MDRDELGIGDEDGRPVGELAPRLEQLIDELQRADEEVEALEGRLAVAQSIAATIREKRIPSLLAEYGLKKAQTEGGASVSLLRKVYASMPDRKKVPDGYAAAIEWLESPEVGGASIVKRTVEAFVGKDPNVADEVEAALRAYEPRGGGHLDVCRTVKVEPSAFTKFIRERLDANKDVPSRLFNVHTPVVAEVKFPKRGGGS